MDGWTGKRPLSSRHARHTDERTESVKELILKPGCGRVSTFVDHEPAYTPPPPPGGGGGGGDFTTW